MSAPTIIESDVERVFFPQIVKSRNQVISKGGRFVYYTNATVAANILTEREIWLRNTSTMNDYMEVSHGFECLKAAYDKPKAKNPLKEILDECYSGLSQEIETFFNGWLPGIRNETYITCVSEHCPTEDQNGRLSMWRAYGGGAGVALIFNGGVMFSEAKVLNVGAFPVSYMDKKDFGEHFEKLVDGIRKEKEFVKSFPRETLRNVVFNMLRAVVLCTKHTGFREEKEWRVIASPRMFPSEHLLHSVEVVRGTPQIVLKIKLQNHPNNGLVGLALPELLNRIIIGPCESPHIIKQAFVKLLTDANVQLPDTKVAVSEIPLRQPT